jgi:hypothetical protein
MNQNKKQQKNRSPMRRNIAFDNIFGNNKYERRNVQSFCLECDKEEEDVDDVST